MKYVRRIVYSLFLTADSGVFSVSGTLELVETRV